MFLVFAAISAVIQWMFCQCRSFLVKLLPFSVPAVLYVSYLIGEGQRTMPLCGAGSAVMGMILGTVLTGIVLGWVLYGLQVMREGKSRDKREG